MNKINKLLASLILLSPLATACGTKDLYGPNPYTNDDSQSEPLDVYGPAPEYTRCDNSDDCKKLGTDWYCGQNKLCTSDKLNDADSDDDSNSDAQSDN